MVHKSLKVKKNCLQSPEKGINAFVYKVYYLAINGVFHIYVKEKGVPQTFGFWDPLFSSLPHHFYLGTGLCT
jgi:hypothetical protein